MPWLCSYIWLRFVFLRFAHSLSAICACNNCNSKTYVIWIFRLTKRGCDDNSELFLHALKRSWNFSSKSDQPKREKQSSCWSFIIVSYFILHCNTKCIKILTQNSEPNTHESHTNASLKKKKKTFTKSCITRYPIRRKETLTWIECHFVADFKRASRFTCFRE